MKRALPQRRRSSGSVSTLRITRLVFQLGLFLFACLAGTANSNSFSATGVSSSSGSTTTSHTTTSHRHTSHSASSHTNSHSSHGHKDAHDNKRGGSSLHVHVNHHVSGNSESNSVSLSEGESKVITGRKRRSSRKSPTQQALKVVFDALKATKGIDNDDPEVVVMLNKLEKLMQFCDYTVDDLEADNGHEDVADQLAAVLGLDNFDSGNTGSDDDVADGLGDLLGASSSSSSLSSSSSSMRKRRSSSKTSKGSRESDKQEIARLKRLVKKLKDHQAAEVGKLVAVKQGVESLVASLSGTQESLQQAMHESSDMERELKAVHHQARAAERLEKEINEIQEHAKINYETGLVELEQEDGEISSLSLEEVAHKVQMASLDKGRYGLYHYNHHGDNPLKMKGADGKADDILSNLADPAVLHADLRMLLDIVLLLGSATIGGMVAAVAYMPPIIGYIGGGVVVGPSGLDLVRTVVEVDTLAQFGSVFFLFAHGLEYSFSEQRQFQTVAVGGCLLTTALCAVCIQVYALASGIVQTPLEGALLGLSSSLSSLSLVLDYLHEQRMLHTVHGKVMVGFLTFQGLMMGLLFSIPPAISGGVVSMGGVGFALLKSFCGIVVVSAFGYLFSRYMMPTLLEFLTKNRANYDELYLLGVVSLAMVMALLTEFMGLSLDLGAFFAGLMLAGTRYMKRTAAAIQPLASVFAAMLFASIGMIINPSFFWANLGVITVVVLQIVIIKVIIVTTVVRLFNYSWHVSIVSGIGLAHVGEFSLLFSSKLQAHMLLSRRAYLIFLAATVTTIVLAPLVLRTMHFLIPKVTKLLGVPMGDLEEYHPSSRAARHYRLPRLS